MSVGVSRAVGLLISLCTAAAGCGPAEPQGPGRFGEVTSAVVILNPIINQGSTIRVTSGTARADVAIKAADLEPVVTDASGLALIEGLPTGSVPFQVDASSVNVQVAQEQELYDVVLAWRDGMLTHVIPPVRYPIGGDVRVLEPGTDIGSAATDGAILLLQPGTYPGFELRSEGALIFGAWSAEDGPLSTIEGDVTVLGGSSRIRGVKITGKLTSNANAFSAAFSQIGSANITGNDVSLLRNQFTMGQATVPSSSAVLVDNAGIP